MMIGKAGSRRYSIRRKPLQPFQDGGALFKKNGGYLLSHLRSTIGAGGLNFSVRNGKRWNPATVTTLIRVDMTQTSKQ